VSSTKKDNIKKVTINSKSPRTNI